MLLIPLFLIKQFIYTILMNIIKVTTVNSTNTFLKQLAKEKLLKNWTVVWAEKQTSGRGQQDNAWFSGQGDNLTFSILLNEDPIHHKHQFYLNRIISLAILKVLQNSAIGDFTVKWPNDIMLGRKKVAGILIENTIQKGYIVQSVIGIGININQEIFPPSLNNAVSLKQLTSKNYDIEMLLVKIVTAIQELYAINSKSDVSYINDTYQKFLFNKEKVSVFQKENYLFNGIIKGVSEKGKLCLLHENENICCYNSHEIKQIL